MNQSACKQGSPLSFGCFNARSLCNKTCGVIEMLKDNDVTICGITETWLKSVDKAKFAEIHDMGYDIISSPRKGRGGGVAFLYDPKIITPIRNDVRKYSSFEALECVLKSSDKMLRFSVVYRSTQGKNYAETKTSKFMEEFDDYLDGLVGKAGSPIICGDFNFHVEDKRDTVAKQFIALCESKGFIQHIDSPTHISGGTLDLMFTLGNIMDSVPISDTRVETNTGTLSDHFLVRLQTTSLTLQDDHTAKFTEKIFREMKKIDVAEFRHDIFCSELNLSEYGTLDETVDLYNEVLEQILDKHAPLISRKFRTGRSEFWDEKCQNARRERRRAKRISKKHPEDKELRNLHHEKCIDADITINQARNNFYHNALNQHKGDAKATYKVMNRLLDKEYGSNKTPNGDDQENAEKLKTFFDQKVKTIYSGIQSSLGKNLSNEKSGDSTPLPEEEYRPTLHQFQEISVEKLESIIKALPNKSSSLDPIPMWLFKNCLSELLPIVHYIVNESLRTGKFPEKLKEASIRPGLKKPSLDVDELKNYRPISNLTYLSKILEKVVHEELNMYIEKNGLFSAYQSGYRKFHSCETAVTKIHNDILMLVDKKENVVLLLLDLSAAFDTINHKLLLNKLKNMYGISGIALNWIKCYLSNRSFRVTVNRQTSGECILEIGVPQGSILGPLLFILYTKDLENIVTKYGLSIHLYADDTQIYFAFDVHSAKPDMSSISSCFSEIKQWMAVNFLKLNEDKTEFIEIGPYVSHIDALAIGGTKIIPVEKAKNLGFLFDDQLNLDAQINAISQICYLNQRDLSRIGNKLSHDLKVQMVHSNILCFLDYCNSVYGKLSEKNVRKLQKIQNNAVRFIYGLYGTKRRETILPYLKKLHFLPIRQRISFKICLLVFKCINNIAPNYLKDMLKLREQRRRSSRLDDDYFRLKVPPRPNFSRSEGAFSYIGPKLWNDLPKSLRSLNSIEVFKKSLKAHFFSIAFENVPDLNI